MMSQDNRLLPVPAVERGLDRPLTDSTPSRYYGAPASEAANIRDYLAIVLKRKWLILSLVLVITSLATIQMYRSPSIYEATTTMKIEPKGKSVLQTKELVINQPDPNYWGTQLELLKSPALARQVALTLDLEHNAAFLSGPSQTGIFSSLRRIFSREKRASTAPTSPSSNVALIAENDPTDQKLTPEELARLEPYEDIISSNLTVEQRIGTNLVNISFRHTDPELAHKICNTLAEVFVNNNLTRVTVGSNRAVDLLAKEVATLQTEVKHEEEVRFNFAKSNNLPPDDKSDNLEAKRLGILSSQLLDAENERKNLQAQYEAAARETDPYAIPDVQKDARVLKLRDRIEELEQKRNALLVKYTPAWPEVRQIDEQLKPLKATLQKAPAEVVASMKARYVAAESRENSLRRSYHQQRGTTTQQNQAQIQMSDLSQKLETNKQYLATLLQRQRELEVTHNDRPNEVAISDPGRVPRAPIGPPRMRNIAIAFLLSLGAGIGLAFLLDFLDDTLKTLEDVDRYIHLPALALIPSSRSERLRLKGGSGGVGGDSTALTLMDDTRSPIAEAYRHLRTSLLLSSAGQPPKTVLVTSSQPSEGKTTTTINTAIMLAQTGAEVVIVDCDLRRPRLHTHFDVPNVRGVTNYLSGESSADSLLQPCEKIANLMLLTSGPVPPNPAELLGSDEMRKLLAELGARFTHIIIDSPPAISFTDASILSTMVDGVMLVVQGGRSSRAVVRRAKQQLMDVGAHIFGVVLNNVKLESQDYYYYAGYYSKYYSDDDAESEGSTEKAGIQGSPR